MWFNIQPIENSVFCLLVADQNAGIYCIPRSVLQKEIYRKKVPFFSSDGRRCRLNKNDKLRVCSVVLNLFEKKLFYFYKIIKPEVQTKNQVDVL